MSAFGDLQQALGEARAAVDARERAVVNAHERLHRLRRDQVLAARAGSTEHLDQTIDDQEQALGRLRLEVEQLRGRELSLLEEFTDFTDPRQNLGRLTDRIPICLFPLRIEYRFKRAGEPGVPDAPGEPAEPLASDELWVRVYPDDISVDSFEPTLSDTEARDARTYWAAVWSAGGDDAALRGAWKVLVAGQGSGRSFFVTQAYAPLNSGDQPDPPAAGPWVILSVPTQAPLVEPEVTALRTYWTAVWRAGDDLGALQDADQDLEAAVGAARAEELRQGYRPRNLAVGPPGTATRDETDVTVAFLNFPTDDEAQVRIHGWATTPRARSCSLRATMRV